MLFCHHVALILRVCCLFLGVSILSAGCVPQNPPLELNAAAQPKLRIGSEVVTFHFVEAAGPWRLFQGVTADGAPLCTVVGDDTTGKSYRLTMSPRKDADAHVYLTHSAFGNAFPGLGPAEAAIAFPLSDYPKRQDSTLVPYTILDETTIDLDLSKERAVVLGLFDERQINITLHGITVTYSLKGFYPLLTKALACTKGATAPAERPNGANPFIGNQADPEDGSNPFVSPPATPQDTQSRNPFTSSSSDQRSKPRIYFS
jgi:hypothetical protein